MSLHRLHLKINMKWSNPDPKEEEGIQEEEETQEEEEAQEEEETLEVLETQRNDTW